MNYVIAKIKKDEQYRNLYSGDSFYNIPANIDSAVAYSPDTLLDEGEWYMVEDFSKKEYCLKLLKEEFRTTDFDMIRHMHNNSEKIEYICAYEEGVFFFQRMLKNSILSKKCLVLGNETKLEKDKSIVINDLPDAIYSREKDRLYFRKIETIMPIFRGIEELYREATKEDVKKFLDSDFIKLVEGYNVDEVKKLNRKRIAVVLEILKEFNKEQRKDVLEYTHKYYPKLEYNKKKFSIGNEDDLKYLLWGIEQRYYTTPVTKEDRVANSTIALRTMSKA